MTVNELMNCGDCRFWSSDSKWSSDGKCHRHAPTELDRRDFQKKAWWPGTTKYQGCGDFEKASDTVLKERHE